MLLDLPTDIIYEIVEYLEKRKKRRLAPPGHFAVVGPAWGEMENRRQEFIHVNVY